MCPKSRKLQEYCEKWSVVFGRDDEVCAQCTKIDPAKHHALKVRIRAEVDAAKVGLRSSDALRIALEDLKGFPEVAEDAAAAEATLDDMR